MRLDKWLATLGKGSRSEVRQMIRDGQAAVNGQTVRDPAADCDPERDTLSLRGTAEDGRIMRHVMMHKPAGVLTAARDPRQRTVMDLLPAEYRSMGCMPVGRLDKDTTGILVFTCDGELSHRLLSPARHVEKRYRALASGLMDAGDTHARRVWDGMIYQINKYIGAMAAVLEGRVDSILLTGRLLRFDDLVEKIRRGCEWIAPIVLYPGEVEHEALAGGALRVLRGEEEAMEYTGVPVFTGWEDE